MKDLQRVSIVCLEFSASSSDFYYLEAISSAKRLLSRALTVMLDEGQSESRPEGELGEGQKFESMMM
jgi:hypothetical protein